jgi:hypothetical protein
MITELTTQFGKATVCPEELMNLYIGKKYGDLSQRLVDVLLFLEKKRTTFLKIPPNAQHFFNVFVESFLYFFTREDFLIPENHARTYILLNHVISNIVAISDFRNTDPQIKILLNQNNNLVKILALYSRRNEVSIDYKIIFNANPQSSSLWYWTYFIGNTVTRTNYENMRRHMDYMDAIGNNLGTIPSLYISEPYFRATYADPDADTKIKGKMNEIIQNNFKGVRINNQPDRKKIAVISGRWFPTSAVYKTQYDYLKALAEEYDLTLITLTIRRENIDASLFREVRHIDINQRTGNLNVAPILDNNFCLVYYPDVGIHPESIYLSNLRIAPIQVTQYGHPVSTFGSEVDYFIGGYDTEVIEKASENYSERLVLIPGIGQIPVYPNYEPQNIKKQREELIVFCTWSGPKINYPMLVNLKEIAQKANKPVLFRFFTVGDLDRWNSFAPTVKEIASILGENNIEVLPNKSYKKYMALIEESDISLDAYPFGGCNTIVDALYLRKPVVSFEGSKAYGRLATGLLKKLKLDELISRSSEEYVAKAVQLINDDEYRSRLQKKISKIDMMKKLFNKDDARYFRKAIDYLIENHEELKRDGSREPIVIR